MFKSIDILDETIYDQQTFDNSNYGGVDRMLGVAWRDCMFVLSQDDEEVGENYYFLEGNAALKEQHEDMMLVEMDDITFVIIDLQGEYGIAVSRKNAKRANELLSE